MTTAEVLASRQEPMTYVPGGSTIDGEWCHAQGPPTGLTWGAEMVRLNALDSAASYDEMRRKYEPGGGGGPSEFGVGLCQGHSEAFRRVAGDLIRYAWWRE